MKTLSLRELGRATLARQLLLSRSPLKVPKALSQLLAIQAQWPKPPFIAFWSRLAKFERSELVALAQKNTVVRGSFFRGTIFLLLPDDWAAFRGIIAPSVERAVGSITNTLTAEDKVRLEAFGRKYFAKKTANFEALREALTKAGEDEAKLRHAAYWIRMRLPLLQVATDVPWGWHQSCDFALSHLEVGKADISALVLRYLAALGPASVADAQNFTGISKLKSVFDALRPKLVTFQDEDGKELFDLPKAPRPDGDTPAPVRFLPDFDNTILSHADRRRFVSDEHKPLVYGSGNLSVLRTVMIDGKVGALWRIDTKKTAKLTIELFGKVTKAVKAELEEEGAALLHFSEPEATAHTIEFVQQ